MGQRDLPEPDQGGRRHRIHQVDAHRFSTSLHRPDPHAHGLFQTGPPQSWLVGDLRSGDGEPEHAGIRGDDRRPTVRRARASPGRIPPWYSPGHAGGLQARTSTGAAHQGTGISQPRPAARAVGSGAEVESPPSRYLSHPARARRAHRRIRDGLSHADGSAGDLRISGASRTR